MKKMLTIMMSICVIGLLNGCDKSDVEKVSEVANNIKAEATSVEKESGKDEYAYEDAIAEECKKIGKAELVDWMLEPSGKFTIFLSGNYEETKTKVDDVVKYLSKSETKYNTFVVLISNYGVNQNAIPVK